MEIFSLSSGSAGNCTLVITNDTPILIDIGISVKQISEKLLMAYGLNIEDITTILISHTHIDHISAVKTIYNKYNHIKFVCSGIVYEELCAKFEMDFDMKRFVITTTEVIGKHLTITPFALNHDKECQGYMINDGNETYVHIADTSKLYDKNTLELLRNKEYYSIESNYDVELTYFDNNREPVLKKRCLGHWGHSSNLDAIETFTKLYGDRTKCVMFNHLSEETNSEELSTKWHMKYLEVWNKLDETKDIKFVYASQKEIVPMDSGRTHKEIRGVR